MLGVGVKLEHVSFRSIKDSDVRAENNPLNLEINRQKKKRKC